MFKLVVNDCDCDYEYWTFQPKLKKSFDFRSLYRNLQTRKHVMTHFTKTFDEDEDITGSGYEGRHASTIPAAYVTDEAPDGLPNHGYSHNFFTTTLFGVDHLWKTY